MGGLSFYKADEVKNFGVKCHFAHSSNLMVFSSRIKILMHITHVVGIAYANRTYI